VMAVAPRMVPRIVCGRRNFQKAALNAANRSAVDRASATGLLLSASCVAPCTASHNGSQLSMISLHVSTRQPMLITCLPSQSSHSVL